MSDTFDEQAAYALQSWSRFDSVIDSKLLRAVCGAFALVAAADGDVSEKEISRFIVLIRKRAASFPKLDIDDAEDAFRDLGSALVSDPVAGRNNALQRIAAVAKNKAQAELVHAAAEIAVLADGRTLDSEQKVLAEIDGALNL